MKRVKYKNALYDVPDEVEYMTTDDGGRVMGWEDKPLFNSEFGEWYQLDRIGEWVEGFEIVPFDPSGAQDSLERVEVINEGDPISR